MRLALWRSSHALEIIGREAADILTRCRHAPNCPGEHDTTVPCLADQYVFEEEGQPGKVSVLGCPDREQRASALVILGAVRMFAPINARKLDADAYHAPSREYFSEIMMQLASAQAELEAVHATSATRVLPPPNS